MKLILLFISQILVIQLVAMKPIRSLDVSEGIDMRFSPEAIAKIKTWPHNTNLLINNLLDELACMDSQDEKIDFLYEKIAILVKKSQKEQRKHEQLLRYVLNRALVLCGYLDVHYEDSNSIEKKSLEYNILRNSLAFAKAYAKVENEVLYKIQDEENGDYVIAGGNPPFVEFGRRYAGFLHQISLSIFNEKAQYAFSYANIMWLATDLYRDKINNLYYKEVMETIIATVQDRLPSPDEKITTETACLNYSIIQQLFNDSNISVENGVVISPQQQ